jgi:hypothetical protein
VMPYFFMTLLLSYKSNDYISSGKAPALKQAGWLDVGVLKVEYEKCKQSTKKFDGANGQKVIFFNDLDTKLFLISNKPMKDYQRIKEDLKSGEADYFPKGVVVICNDNFEECISKTFSSWKKLYIKARSITLCSCKDCQSAAKCSCKVKGVNCNEECDCHTNGQECKRCVDDEFEPNKKVKL